MLSVWVLGRIDYFRWWQCFVAMEVEVAMEMEMAVR
jgi:hypothetical protein